MEVGGLWKRSHSNRSEAALYPAHVKTATHPWRCSTLCIYAMRYEWGKAKNLRNQRKHDGISFELAALVFEDKGCLVYADRIDSKTEEQRWHAIGAAQIEPGAGAVVLVVHVYREDYRGEEIIRIISARAAEKHEIRRYQDQTMD